MENQELNPPPIQNPSSPKLVYVLMGLLVLVFGGIGGYLLGTKKISAPTPTIAPKTVTKYPAAITSDETAGWKTYTNTKVGFQINYPPNYLEPTLPSGANGPTIYANGEEDNESILFTGSSMSDNFSLQVFPFAGSVQELINYQSTPSYDGLTRLTYMKNLVIDDGVKIEIYKSNAPNAYPEDPDHFKAFFVGKGHGFILTSSENFNEKRLDQIISAFKFLPVATASTGVADETMEWKMYTNSEKGYSIKYPKEKFVRLVCPGEELTLIQREQGDEREIVNMPTCNRGGKYDIEIVTKNSEFKIPQQNEYFSVDKKEITLNGIKAMKYTTKMIKEYPGPAVSFSVQVFVNNGGKYYEIFLGREQLSDLFDQILGTFRFL